MNNAQSIQRSKLITSYGGVGSTVDTIDNLSYKIEPFDKWALWDYIKDPRNRGKVGNLKIQEERLIKRIKSIGFPNVKEFFLTDPFEGETIEEWNLKEEEKKRMVSSSYFPRMFYCPKCHKLHDIETWGRVWRHDKNWGGRPPKCTYCSSKKGNKIYGPSLMQVRFVLASMSTGDFIDIPWGKIYYMKTNKNTLANVWDFTGGSIPEKEVTFTIKKGSSDLIDIYVKSADGIVVTMAEIMNHYFVLNDANGNRVAYRPVIRSANNVYFSYVISSVFIPKHTPTQDEIDTIREGVDEGESAAKIKKNQKRNPFFLLSEKEIQEIIDNNFVVPLPNYSTEETFRLDEFDCLTNDAYYHNNIFDMDPDRLIAEKYIWKGSQIPCIKQAYLLRRMNVTSVQVAYSRIDKISQTYLSQWEGTSDNPKFWFDVNENKINQKVKVALHPTCTDRKTVEMMPAVSSYGEGFFIELDPSSLAGTEVEKEVFLHTLSHLIMKSLEFFCGYPLSSMCERLYFLPKSITKADEDKFGFMIYSANGEAGSYGGITTLFETGKIETIIQQALMSAEDCPNDPICESEGGSCFACVQIPETACEKFNTMLNRNVVIQWMAQQNSTKETSSSHETEDDEGTVLA